MPGDPYLSDYDYGAGYGYAPTGSMQTLVTPASAVAGVGGSSHTSFIIWLIVLTAGSVFVLHGLRVAGFTFIFKR